jgi:hypothetical protein
MALSTRSGGNANDRSCQDALPWTGSENNVAFMWHLCSSGRTLIEDDAQ